MRFSCSQEDLSKGLKIAGRAVASRAVLPILSNVMLSTGDGRLKLSATDLEISINCWIGATVEEDGATTVPAHTLIDLVNSLPPEQVDLELDLQTQTLKLSCARQKAKIKGIDAQEFPIIPTIGTEESLGLPADILCGMIKRAIISASTDESGLVLEGIFVQLAEGQLTLAAADGFRLSVCTAQVPSEKSISAIVPTRSLSELARFSGEEPIQVELRENQAIFQTGDVALVSQLIEGNFPDYQQIIPKEYTTRTAVDTKAFRQACATAYIFAKEAADLVRLTIEQGKMTVSAVCAELGDNVVELDAQVEGTGIELGLNVTYLLDVLGVIGAEKVVLETTTGISPVVFKPVGGGEFVHVIMPLRVSEVR